MMMLQALPATQSSIVQIVALITGCVTACFTAWIAYQQIKAKQVSDGHTTQIEQVKGLVNGALGGTLSQAASSAQTGLTAAKALAVVAPIPENIALAEAAQIDATKAREALEAHNATQDAINASIAAGK
jgi:hypothetical protein